MKNIKIYTDGSCLGNPGPGGWAVLIINNAKKTILKGGAPDTTNNRMEMTAISQALKWMTKNNIKSATIFSDSNLLIQSLTKNWKKKKNKDLWAELGENLRDKKIDWQWVKGHHIDKYNNEADKIAFEESIKAQRTAPKIEKPQQELF